MQITPVQSYQKGIKGEKVQRENLDNNNSSDNK